MRLLDILREQKDMKLSGQLYEITQINMAYNTNRMEGSTLTLYQTRLLYTDDIVASKEGDKYDDFVEMKNHFRLFDYMLETADKPLTHKLLKEYHAILKNGTSDAEKDWFAVGDYKKEPNIIGNHDTTSPEKVPEVMENLLARYESANNYSMKDLVRFHAKFEGIHPFQDGNGRVGRIVLFKECLRNNITPIIVPDGKKLSYYNGLNAYEDNPKKLNRTMEKFQRGYQKEVEKLVGNRMDTESNNVEPDVEYESKICDDNHSMDIWVRPHVRNGHHVDGYWRRRHR